MTTLVMTALPAAADSSLRISTGSNFSSGKYGTDDKTEIFSAPVRIAWRTGDFELSASTSYVSVDGTGNVIPGDLGPIQTLRCLQARDTRPDLFDRFCRDRRLPTTERVKNSGMGDVILGFSWSLPVEVTGKWLIDLGGRVKLPTASEDKNLGTGETDFSFSVDIARSFGKVTPFVNVGYRIFGDPVLDDGLGEPFQIDLENGFTTSVGLIFPVGKKANLSISYDYLEKTVRTVTPVTDSHELTMGLGGPIGDKGWRWSLYGVAGLSQSSPDIAAGVSLSYRFSFD